MEIKGKPIKMPEVLEKDGYGILYQDTFGKHWSYWSTDDPDELKPALLLLLCSGCGFRIAIKDFAFNLHKMATLEIGRGTQWVYRNHQFFVSLDDVQEIFEKPEQAVDRFFELWKEHEVGDYWAEVGFSGHAGPSHFMKEEPK